MARQLTRYCASHSAKFEIVGALVKPERACLGDGYPLVGKLLDLIDLRPSLIVECAGHEAVHRYGARILRMGIDLVPASVGALADEELLITLRRAEIAGGARLILSGGALPGWDMLQTAALTNLERVILHSSKPPEAWRGTLAEEKVRLEDLRLPVTFFDGSAREAARLYPKNANIAATAALAGIGFEKTRVVLTADPTSRCNVHRLVAHGAFGQFSMEISANPSPDNPKTSLIAAMSILRVLEQEVSLRRKRRSRNTRPIVARDGAMGAMPDAVATRAG